MMKRSLLIHALMLFWISSGYAQQDWDDDDHQLSMTIPEMSLISIVPSNEVVKLEMELPEAAGSEPNAVTGSNVHSGTWINYSTCKKKQGSYKKLMVQVTSGEIPKGTKIELTASSISTGKGQRGTPSSTVTLSNQQQVLVNNIGGCCSGKGKNFGHQLTYKLVLVNLDELEFESPNTFITVTYTLSD